MIRLDPEARTVGERDPAVVDVQHARHQLFAQRIRVAVHLQQAIAAMRRQQVRRGDQADAAAEEMRAIDRACGARRMPKVFLLF